MRAKSTVLIALVLVVTAGCDGGGDAASPFGALSVLPPVTAIVLAVITRQVLVALFVGIWLGATFACAGNPVSGFLRVLDTHVVQALGDRDHAAIVLFSMSLGGMIRVLSAAGGLNALVARIRRVAHSVRRVQLATWCMGVLVFFDDYANTLLVGHTMRPFTDRLRISREKLAYLVDSTAAPITALAPISTWIGYEVGLLGAAFEDLGLGKGEAYPVFLASLPFRFYGLLALGFVLLVILMNRDFGPMYRAEKRARTTGKLLADGAVPLLDRDVTDVAAGGVSRPHWVDAVAPLAVVVIVTVAGLMATGSEALSEKGEASGGLREIIAEADAYKALMWAAFSGALTAIVLALRSLSLQQTIDAYLTGVRSMVLAMMVLVLAWSMGGVCSDLKTAEYCVAVISRVMAPWLLPPLVFLTAAFVAFATGTSWGTMGILVPIVVPLAWQAAQTAGAVSTGHPLFLASVAGVLSGATFGDHCSPISDTTIMSSMAAACDHVDHVKTQLPYALVVALVAVVAGYLPGAAGVPPLVCLAGGFLLLALLLRFAGRALPPT